MNAHFRNFALWVIIALLLIALFQLFQSPAQHGATNDIAYSDFMKQVDNGEIRSVIIQEQKITGTYSSGSAFQTYAPDGAQYVDELRSKGVLINARPPAESSPLLGALFSWLPMLIILGIWIFVMRQMQGSGGKAMGFGKSKAKLLTEAHGRVTFEDVAGIDEAKEDLQEIVEFLRDPQKFQRLGGRIPRGVLLVGPPGTGKTLTARAVAGEANVPFFTISGSDFVEMFVGVGASRVRDMFEQAKKNAPCIIFIDEIDAVGRHRGAGLGGGNDEREQTLNQLLVEMDGFEPNEGIIIIAATNRPDVLDPALLRPGRFDRQIVVPNPDSTGREKILKVHMRKVPLAPDVDVKTLARGTPGFSGADLMNLVNEAALLASRFDRARVTMLDFENAKDKVMMGTERRSMVISDKEKKLTAYHEIGHALTAKLIPENDPLHKVPIIPRGRALGVTHTLPIDERHTYPQSYCEAVLCFCLGGRVVENLVFGEITTGGQGDYRQATNLARQMVCDWGMSSKLGPVAYGQQNDEIFLGREIAQRRSFSEKTSEMIDEEIKTFILNAEKKVKGILGKNMDKVHLLTEALLEHETLDDIQIELILSGKILEKVDQNGHAEKTTENSTDGEKASEAPVEESPSLEEKPASED